MDCFAALAMTKFTPKFTKTIKFQHFLEKNLKIQKIRNIIAFFVRFGVNFIAFSKVNFPQKF